jgi:predicted dienelactone hydrolase
MSALRTGVVAWGMRVLMVGAGFAQVAPDIAGPFAFAEYATSLRDEGRKRSMELLVLYPVTQAGQLAERRPLVIFNHGFLLSADGYRSYAQHVASHGFVVALPTFPMTFFNVHHARLAEEVRFVIDYLLMSSEEGTHPLYGRIDPERIGSSGHSLGGKLSLLEAVSDARVLAAAVPRSCR